MQRAQRTIARGAAWAAYLAAVGNVKHGLEVVGLQVKHALQDVLGSEEVLHIQVPGLVVCPVESTSWSTSW